MTRDKSVRQCGSMRDGIRRTYDLGHESAHLFALGRQTGVNMPAPVAHPLTPDEKTELRKAAEAATPGPWAYATGCGAQVIAGVVAKDEPGHVACAKGGWFLFELETDNYFGHVQFDDEEIDEEDACEERAFADSKFIALANPATVLALLDENDKLAGWLEVNRLALEEECVDQNLMLSLRAENARLAAEVERLTKWIPCSERMPADEERVLLVYRSRDGARVVSAFCKPDYAATRRWQFGGGQCCSVVDAVAWMPLPEPPK